MNNSSLNFSLAALLLIGTTSASLAAGTPGPAQSFEFEWQTSDGAFSPTFLDVTAVLNSLTPTTASATSITDFQVTTPQGTWTPAAYAPNIGLPRNPISWTGAFTVTGTVDNPILTFTDAATLSTQSPQGNLTFGVTIQTGSITGTTMSQSVNDVSTSTGTWVYVPDDDTTTDAPDNSNSLVLLSTATLSLAGFRRIRRANA